jgi:outer membrane protein OmpA-like peptidoglycan-associated protein
MAGSVALKGCPDRDGDGIPDIDDKCPDQAGVAANKGCPEVTAEEKLVFDKALRGIQFQSGKSIILSVSYPIIDEVVGVLNNNPSYNLEINGHTDNTGTPAHNLRLSQERADAVKAYFIAKGITPNRIKTSGFGDTQPVSDNYTEKGRALNRRVEFKVSF